MAQRIPYTHFFDLIHKLIIVFGPIGTIEHVKKASKLSPFLFCHAPC